MRRRWAAPAAACLALATGCGDSEPEAAAGLGYVPADPALVAVIPTDLDDEQLPRLGRLLEPTLRDADARSLRDLLAQSTVGEASFERDVEPLLGGPLVVAAIDVRRDGGGLDAAQLGGLDDDEALVSGFADPRAIVGAELARADELPWVRALRSLRFSVRLEDAAISADAKLETDPEGLRDEDLPLAPGHDAPAVGRVDGAIAAGNRDQSRTTVFLARLARTAFPDSRFVREVDALEADLGISFEQEVLAQFNGPSASVATPDGAFAAVSDVADPDRMRALLPRLAPRLPPVLRGLQGLGNELLSRSCCSHPTRRWLPGVLPALGAQVGVQQLPPDGDELLFEITGLDEPGPGGEPPLPGGGEIVFGMIGLASRPCRSVRPSASSRRAPAGFSRACASTSRAGSTSTT